jgi:hypothetical protein
MHVVGMEALFKTLAASAQGKVEFDLARTFK